MKQKTIFTIGLGFILLTSSGVKAQSINVTSTGVGIGTASPTAKLEVSLSNSAGWYGNTKALRVISPDLRYFLDLNTIVLGSGNVGYQFSANGNTGVTLSTPGYIGIGTTNPTAPLTISYNDYPGFYITGSSGNATGIKIQNDNYSAGNWWSVVNDSQGGLTFNHNGSDKFWMGRLGSDNVIFNAGNVGIGTTTPSQKLEVAGSVKATSFISATKTYADYVFNKDYKLATLSEVEKHIAAEGHLPGIPSEKEAKANGIDLGDMQVRLLAQVEQLTLHMIEHEKALEALKQENVELKRELKTALEAGH